MQSFERITLYKKGTKGETRIWHIDVAEGKDGEGIITSESGSIEGKKVTSVEKILEGKNQGKANGTNPFEQAVLEAESKSRLKMKEGYVISIDLLQEAGTKGSGKKGCMLAQCYDPTGAKKGSKTLAQLRKGKKNRFVGVQRKKDGNRANLDVKINPGLDEVTFYSRSGDKMPYDFPKIKESILNTIRNNPFNFKQEEEFVLDGEMFTSEISFNKLNGILRKKTLTDEHREVLDTVKLHLYDVFSDDFYPARHDYIIQFASDMIHVEEYYVVEATDDNLLEYLRKFLAEGEEGVMIRDLDSPYQNKRTWDLCKYKVDQTDEYKILGIEKHALHEMIGAFVMEAPTGKVDRDGNSITSFKAGTTGLSHQENKEIYASIMKAKADAGKDFPPNCEYIGQKGMVRFFEFSEYGIPRFPKFVGLRSDV